MVDWIGEQMKINVNFIADKLAYIVSILGDEFVYIVDDNFLINATNFRQLLKDHFLKSKLIPNQEISDRYLRRIQMRSERIQRMLLRIRDFNRLGERVLNEQNFCREVYNKTQHSFQSYPPPI